MTKREYMNKLADGLTDLAFEERIEALQYYEDYFADAGDDKEQDIINELGSPESLAEAIKNELNGSLEDMAKKSFKYPDMPYEQYGDSYADDANYVEEGQYQKNKRGMTGGKFVAIILGAIFLGPFAIAIVSTVFGLAIGTLAVFGSLLLVFSIAGAALMLGGVVTIVVGVAQVFVSIPGLIFVAGTGLVLFGLGSLMIALFMVMLKMTRFVFVKSISGLGKLFNRRRAYA